jgi:glycosyltransferase involved in cell wall biosynthesis
MFGEASYEAELRRLTRSLGIQDRVEFRGFREDVWAELAELDILVHCSITPEPFGQVISEGMAAGLPLVAAAAGGPADLVTDGVDGLLTPPGDPERLALALRQLADDSHLRASLSSRARRTSRKFAPDRIAHHLLAIYGTVLRG